MSAQSILFMSVVDGDTATALSEVSRLLAQNVLPQTIMEEHLIPAMDEVGKRFEENEFFVPELMIAARTMQESMKILNPLLKTSGIAKVGRVVIGTVQGDMHDIGKNLVAAMLEGNGFEVIDLGVDVTPEKFVAAAKEQEGTIIALSALLTTTMPQMKKVIEALQNAGIRGNAKVIIGGAPVTQEFSTAIGADGYSENASTAVALTRSLTR